MKILITQRLVKDPKYDETRDALSHDWHAFLNDLFPQCSVIPVPNILSDIELWVEKVGADAVVFSNGNDFESTPQRDLNERKLFTICLQRGLPVLGVCRGFQVINIFLGGGYTPHLQQVISENHAGIYHEVLIVEPTFEKIAQSNTLCVNSFHHHGVLKKDISNKCTPFAVSAHGVIEGYAHKDLPVIGVQWHPEREKPFLLFDKKVIKMLFENGKFW